MAEGKKSFLLYADYIETFECLTKEQAGELILHILRYINDKKPPPPEDILVKVALLPIIKQLKRDLKGWEAEKAGRTHAAILGNIARWHPDIYAQIQHNEITIEEAISLIESQKSVANHTDPTASDTIRQESGTIPSASDTTNRESLDIANIAVNVNVNDTVNDTVTNKEDKSSLPDGGVNPAVGVIKSDKKGKKKVAAKKKGKNPDSEPYWHLIRKKWVWFNKTHLRFNVEPIPDRDYSHIHRIIEKLRERAVGQAVDWTEKNALERWEKFLTTAYTKHKWLSEHFLAGNLESQMQDIFRLIDNPNGQHGKQKSTTGSVGKTIEFDRP